MQDQNEPPSALLDLSRYTEATRRELYDRLVRIQRTTPEPPPGAEREPSAEFDPVTAELSVFHAFGRWFATWRDLEVSESVPEHLRRELVRIQSSRESPEGILLFEV